MATFAPLPAVTIADGYEVYGFLEQTPVMWLKLADQASRENGTSIDGKYSSARGELHGPSLGGNRGDTYITGTAARSGLGFTVVSGAWADVFHDEYHCWGLSLGDGSAKGLTDTPAEATATDKDSDRIPSCEIVVRRGQPPVTTTGPDTTHNRNDTYAHIYIGYGSTNGLVYRLELEYGTPIRLGVSYDGGVTFNPTNQPRALGNLDTYMRGNDREIRFVIHPNDAYDTLTIECGSGDYLTHSPIKSLLRQPNDDGTLLPQKGKFRFLVKNGTFRTWIMPGRFGDLVVNVMAPRNLGAVQPNMDAAFVTTGSLYQPDPKQTLTANIVTDGQRVSYKATVKKPDAGDGKGSASPPVASDFALIIPPLWSDNTSPIQFPTPLPTEVLRTQSCQFLSVCDDISQTFYSSGAVHVNNYGGYYSGSYGNVALKCDAACYQYDRSGHITNASSVGRVFTGWGGSGDGITFRRFDPRMTMSLHCQDRSLSMQKGLNDEHVFDGWYLYGAVRWLAQLGGIHPRYLTRIPNMPYGPATGVTPVNDPASMYYQLPRGYGNSPRFRYGPGMSIWSILCDLVTKMAIVDEGFQVGVGPNFSGLAGALVPFYHGFDIYGNYFFEAVNFARQQPKAIFSDRNLDGTGMYQFCDTLTVTNTIENMRTSLDFMGIDALTYELLYVHLPMPDYVKHAVGFRLEWQERHAAWASQEYLEYIANQAARQCQLPTQRISFTVPFQPNLYAGDVIGVSEKKLLFGGAYYKIDSIATSICMNDDGRVEGTMLINAKNLANVL